MKNKKNLLFYKIALIILIISAIVIGSIIFKKQYDDQIYHKENAQIAEEFEQKLEENKGKQKSKEKIELKYQGYNVIGLIEIPKINLKYPILEKTTKATMRTSISRFSGGEINSLGNVSLAGHNNYSGTMFGNNKKLKLNDKILLTDLNGQKIEYVIYNIFITNPDDVSVLETKDETIREVTLITCKNGRSERLIIQARENS